MNFKNEKQLLIGIKYTLPSLVLVFSLIVTVFLYVKNKNDFEHIKENTEKEFINHQKKLIKEQINNIYDYIIQIAEDYGWGNFIIIDFINYTEKLFDRYEIEAA